MTTMQDAVRSYCKNNKIRKQDFAANVGVSPAKLSHWLAGRTRFNQETLERIDLILQKDAYTHC